MLPRKNRVSRDLFKEVFGRTRVWRGQYVILRTFFMNDGSNPRFAFVAPKKVAKQAVLRNALRRAGYRVVRQVLPLLSSGWVCILIFKKEASLVDENALREDIMSVLRQAGIIDT